VADHSAQQATRPPAPTNLRVRRQPLTSKNDFARPPDVRRQIEVSARTTAGIYKINQAILKTIRIPIPGLDEQRIVIDEIEELRRESERLQLSIDSAASRARRLRAALLAEAFAGRLVFQNPDDEPASVLLDRIRAERAAEPKPRRTRRAAP
jgi:type I restriction enzyme, S subunit